MPKGRRGLVYYAAFSACEQSVLPNFPKDILISEVKAATAPTPDENIISDDNADDNVVVPKKENIKVKPVPVIKDVKPVVVKPKVSKSADDALTSILGNKGGDGNDTKSGNKGNANGSLNSNGYLGNGSGNGTGGGNGTGNGTGNGSGIGPGNGGGQEEAQVG